MSSHVSSFCYSSVCGLYSRRSSRIATALTFAVVVTLASTLAVTIASALAIHVSYILALAELLSLLCSGPCQIAFCSACGCIIIQSGTCNINCCSQHLLLSLSNWHVSLTLYVWACPGSPAPSHTHLIPLNNCWKYTLRAAPDVLMLRT